LLNVSPSGTFRRADWASVADASSTKASCGEVRPTGGSRGRRRLGMGPGNMARWKYQSVGASRESCGVHNRLQDEVPDDVVCETMARVQTRPALLKLLGCPLSPTQLIQLRRDPVGPTHFRVPDVAANLRPCCRSTVLLFMNYHNITDTVENRIVELLLC